MAKAPFNQFVFGGEESARFARFAQSALAAQIDNVVVHAVGREPLTARPVSVKGSLVAAELDGYIRFITIKDDNSDISHNIAGSNATRSIAARTVSFSLTLDGVDRLQRWTEETGEYVPKLIGDTVVGAAELRTCERALAEPSDGRVREVLELLDSDIPQVRTEAALTLRGLSNVINAARRVQLATEAALISHCGIETDRDTLVAGLEDLGYIGDERSKTFLASFLDNPRSDQACWAAAIALGRLRGGEEVSRPRFRALAYDNLWVRRAALLCLARRTQQSARAKFEPVFGSILRETDDDLLRRYACLGLSRFREFEAETWEQLTRILAAKDIAFATRGYAALAISCAYHNCPQSLLGPIRGVLGAVLEDAEAAAEEIDTVWAVEFLGELASISGLPDIASSLYRHIAGEFSDWRAHYYLAISCYELGEAEAMRGEGEDAIVRFSEAQRQLSFPVSDTLDDVSATIEFRKTVVEARRQLQGILAQWRDTYDAERIRLLAASVDAVRDHYQRYATPEAQVGRDRQLVRREVEYLRLTVKFMELLKLFMQLDAHTREVIAPEESLGTSLALLAQAERLTAALDGSTQITFSLPLYNLLNEIKTWLKLADEAAREKAPGLDRLALIYEYVAHVRDAFWKSSWPMPGRACPVYGLGRAVVGVRSGDSSGTGTWRDPLILSSDGSLILPLFIKIIDMAVGLNSQLQVVYSIAGGDPKTIPVHAVEDEYPLPIDLNAYSGYGSLAVEVRAIFVLRDCTQEAFRSTYHVKIARN